MQAVRWGVVALLLFAPWATYSELLLRSLDYDVDGDGLLSYDSVSGQVVSHSHLDEAADAGSANSLMPAALFAGEAIHDPGPMTRGLLTDEGWTVSSGTNDACSFTVSPMYASILGTGGTGSVSVSTDSSCTWTAASNTSVFAITSGASGTGSGTVTYAASANTGRSRSGSLTIAGQTVLVSQDSVLPTLNALPTPLQFGAINTGGGTLVAQSPSQEVTISVFVSGAAFSNGPGTGSVKWTATSNQPWLLVAPLAGAAGSSVSGTGTGRFRVSVASSPILPATGAVRGMIQIAAPEAQNDWAVFVTLTLAAPATTAAPFGQVDTPINNATGVQGAIGVTGWALDDVGVDSVKIYRNCLPVDGACQSVNGYSVTYVGDAAFVPGARDLGPAFAHYPQNYRGGWGYLMLTNMLPNVASGLGYGGQGPLTIYAFATDLEGNRTLLGRAWTGDGLTSPTSISMANATIAKPFGAIDTPAQGQTVSGRLANFGWALTPDSNASPDGADILIATDGSKMTVVIDGAAVGTVNYNQCRGTVGNPVPAGLYCDDDVANVFGNPTPQSTGDPRTANPTRFRNLDAGRAAIGAFDIDTTQLTNRRHSIAWGVTDSAGRAEGIGSRDFVVLNGSSLTASRMAAAMVDNAAVVALGRTADLDDRSASETEVWGRTGFDFTRSTERVAPNADGVRRVTMPELGRLELWLGEGVTAGYLKANADLRSLPPGSKLDTATGCFTWGPLVGYIGPYDLVFLNGDGQIPIRVTLHPKSSETTGLMRAYIDLPAPLAIVSGPLTIAGWALDTGAWHGSGVGAVHVWAHRVDMAAEPAVFLGAADLGVVRPDVAAAVGAEGERTGWQLAAAGLPPGLYDVTTYFWSTRTDRFEDARTVRITVR